MKIISYTRLNEKIRQSAYPVNHTKDIADAALTRIYGCIYLSIAKSRPG